MNSIDTCLQSMERFLVQCSDANMTGTVSFQVHMRLGGVGAISNSVMAQLYDSTARGMTLTQFEAMSNVSTDLTSALTYTT